MHDITLLPHYIVCVHVLRLRLCNRVFENIQQHFGRDNTLLRLNVENLNEKTFLSYFTTTQEKRNKQP